MSLMKQSDVKNHLSARHRTEIHLLPQNQTNATAFPQEEPGGMDSKAKDSVEGRLKPSSAAGPELAAKVTRKSILD